MSDQPIRILVVDDDLATRMLAGEALAADGFDVCEAEDGQHGVEQFAALEPTAILLDVNMPRLDGYEACRRIRQLPGGAATSIMVMTATDDVDAVARAFAAGATDFLTKPLNLPLLAHRVRYMLRAAETAAEARAVAARLVKAQSLARLVQWRLAPDGTFRWASDPLAVLWPDAPAGFDADVEFESFIHPEDRAQVAAAMLTPANHQIEFRLLLPDGSVRMVHQDAELETTEAGAGMIGATQDITERKRAEAQIAQLAYYDDVTGIPNRQFLRRHLECADPTVARAAIAIDLGSRDFDWLAATAHESLVRAATARVLERIRGSDLTMRLDQAARRPETWSGPTLVARTAHDELIVLTDRHDQAALVARQIATAFADPFRIAGRELLVRPRFGAATHPDAIDDLRELVDAARTAMVEAERVPPRDVVIYSRELRLRGAERAALTRRLELALDHAGDPTRADQPAHDELTIEYAVRVDPITRTTIGVRARPRFSPATVDVRTLEAVLRTTPMLRTRLAMWTASQACREAADRGWPHRLAIEVPHGRIAVDGFIAQLERILGDSWFAAHRLDLEVEGLPRTDVETARLASVLHAVRDRGIRIGLAGVDDSCSVRDLRRLPVDYLRIDCATVNLLGASFFTAIAAIARGLGLQLAATGMDSPAELATLDDHAVDEVTGAMFGPALDGAAIDLVASARGPHADPSANELPELPPA